MADLITSARAKYNLNNLATTSNEDTTIAALVTACSKAIKRFCRREFDSQTFDELYAGTCKPALVLNQFPIISVARVAYGPTTVLTVTNTSASNQRATVQVTSTGLDLTRVASGVSTTNTLTFAGNATLGALATAIAALGNGWSGTVADSRFTNWASADLRAVQGSLNAKDVTAELRIHVNELSDYEIDTNRGLLYRGRWYDDEGVGWPGGVNYWRAIYTAGFATVPEDVQEACAQWVAALFWQTKRDPGLISESIPGAVSRMPKLEMPGVVRRLLGPYVNYRL
jgi:hypothetical protein